MTLRDNSAPGEGKEREPKSRRAGRPRAGRPADPFEVDKMGDFGDFGFVVLIIFIIIRLLIAVGLLYLVIYEVRKYRGSRVRKRKETDKNADGKDAGGSSGSRD